MKKQILLIGGYGGVGRSLAKYILEYYDCTLIIAGRNKGKAEALVAQLRQKFGVKTILPKSIDARDKESLIKNFQNIDLVIVTATIPDHMHLVAEAALETHTDVMDILVRGDVVDRLKNYEKSLQENGRRFITQCGFHPGLIAPIMKLGREYFDDYQEAKVVMAMDAIFENPKAIQELIFELVKGKPQILENGQWRKADYRDVIEAEFNTYFEKKKCYPLQMKEIYGLDRSLGLSNAGVYASGFSDFIDNFIFPLAFVLGKINLKLSEYIACQLIFQSIKKKLHLRPRVEFVLKAQGIKEGKEKTIALSLVSEDAFELTAAACLAGLHQYFDHSIAQPGLYLMGQALQEKRLFQDLEKMGIPLQIRT